MAELYLKQGHRDQALAIYRELRAARPDDTQIAKRLAELENKGGAMGFREHLQRVVDNVPGAVSGAVLGYDGIAIDTYEVQPGLYDATVVLPEYAAIAHQAGQSATRVPNVGEFRDMIVQTDNLACLIRPLTAEYIIAVLLTPQAMMGKARYLMRVVAPALTKELA
jgi:predicted regulator of Ras-like GTPase activity (Roadblock/LC7/MglB family)